jgi:hypothetical protein
MLENAFEGSESLVVAALFGISSIKDDEMEKIRKIVENEGKDKNEPGENSD